MLASLASAVRRRRRRPDVRHHPGFPCHDARDGPATVSGGGRNFAEKRVIKWTRGEVEILNRAKLEDCACECYGAIREDRFGEGPLRQGKAFKPDA